MINYRVIVLSSKEPDNKFVGWLRPLEGSTNDMELLFYNNLSWKPIGWVYPSKITPLMDGVASVGVSKLYAREDHVHPSDTSKANKEDVYTKEEIIAINDEFIKKFETIDEAIQSLQSTLSDYQSEVNNLKESKQDKLVSGTNIKTINNESILGAGNISLLTLEEAKKVFIPLTSIGAPNGVASLNESGIIPSDQLPSYVDDVIEVYATYDKDATGNLSNIKLYKDTEHSNIISTGESGKIYINITENEPSYNFRWSGIEFVYITTGGVVIGEITGTAYDGKKGKDTTDKLNTHVLDYNNPHKVTKAQVGLENVDNTSDLNKPISTATQNALDKRVSKIDICNHGTQTNPESTGSKFYRLINNKAFYIDNAVGYVAIEIPAINNPNYVFDILIIGGSKEVGRLNINTRVVSGEVYSVIANQYGLKEIIPVSAGLTQDGSKLAVLLGSSTWIIKTINVDISIGGQNSYSIKDTNATISFITDISSYKGIKTSNINSVDYSTIAGINNIQPYRDDNIFDKDPKSFNLNPGQSINVWGIFPEVGNGLLQIFRIIASASYKVTFFKYDTHDIYTRMWWDSDSSGGLRLSDWEKIPVIPMNGTSAQFVKGDGSLDNNEYIIKEDLDQKVDNTQEFISNGLTIIKYNNLPTLWTGSYTGYIVIKIPIIAPTPIFDLTLNIFASYKADNIKLYISGYSATSTSTFTTLATNQIGGQYNLPVQCGWGSEGNLRVILGSETTVWHNHVITAELYTNKAQVFDPEDIQYTKETDISSYTQLRESAYKLVDLQTIEKRDIFTQDPDSFNMESGQTRCFTTVLDSTTNPIGSGTLYGTIWLTKPTDTGWFHVVFKDHQTNTIYTRLWEGSNRGGGDGEPKLHPWKKITPIDVSGTADQFIKGDGSLDSTEYRLVLIDKSKTTNVISRRDFLYTIANTSGSTLTGTLVIEIPLATSRIYEFEVIIGSYRYYHKPTSLFFHLYRDKNSNPYNNCVCTKVGPLSYENIRVAEKTDGQNFCILIGNLDSTWHNELIRIPELVEIANYLDSGGINIEATAYITTDESVFSKIGNISTNSYYDPSSPSSISLNGFSDTTEGIDSDISDNDSLNQAFKKLDITTKRNAVNNLVGCSEKCTVKGTSQHAYTQLMFNRPIVAGKYYTVTIESIDEVVDEDYDPAPGFTGILYDSNTSTSLSASGTFTKEKLSITFKATVSSKTAPCLLLYAGVAGSSTTGRITTFNKVIVTEGTTPAHQWYPSYDDMVRKVTDRNLLRIFDLEQGHINTTNGVNTNVNYAVRTKNFIPINSTKLYAQAFYGRYYTPLIYYYDIDKGYLSYKTILDDSWSEVLTVPESAKYIKLVLRRTIEEYIPDEEGNPTEDRVPLTLEYVMMDKYNRISISEEGYQTSWFMSDLDLVEIIDNKITSAKPNISANLWGNQFTGTEDFSNKSLYIKGSTTATWSKGLTINKTGDITTGGAFIGAYGPNTGIPSHMCLGWAYSQASMIINLSSKKVALGVNLNPTNDYYDENVNVIGNLCTTGNNLLKPTLSGTWETGLYVKVSNENVPLVSLKGNNQIHGIFNFGPYISQNILLDNTSISSDLTVTGDLTTNKASSTEGFFETSDEKVKDFKENIEVDLEKLSKLSKKYFSFKRTPDKLNIGVSAQEIKEIYPEIVSESSSGILSVDYSKLSVIALAAIDKLYNRIVEIEKRLNNEY